jgi:hypothetical protein
MEAEEIASDSIRKVRIPLKRIPPVTMQTIPAPGVL